MEGSGILKPIPKMKPDEDSYRPSRSLLRNRGAGDIIAFGDLGKPMTREQVQHEDTYGRPMKVVVGINNIQLAFPCHSATIEVVKSTKARFEVFALLACKQKAPCS